MGSFLPEHFNVLYSSDDNYAQHMGVSIYSLLNTNRDFERISVYIIDNGISRENKKKLDDIISGFGNAEHSYIDFTSWKNKLHLNMEWNISLSSYARLFAGSMIPDDVGRILYLDCDMMICDSLKTLWNTNLQGNILGAVQDSVSDETKAAVGLHPENRYFNAGLLLIDLNSWRNAEAESACMNFIEDHGGIVRHHDQGVLNGLFGEHTLFLPLRCNLMTIHYMFSRGQILKYFGENAAFFEETEISAAKEKPAILHYTPSFTSRPWVKGCRHPLKQLYWDNLSHTPWAGAKPQKNTAKWHVRLAEWRYRTLPF